MGQYIWDAGLHNRTIRGTKMKVKKRGEVVHNASLTNALAEQIIKEYWGDPTGRVTFRALAKKYNRSYSCIYTVCNGITYTNVWERVNSDRRDNADV